MKVETKRSVGKPFGLSTERFTIQSEVYCFGPERQNCSAFIIRAHGKENAGQCIAKKQAAFLVGEHLIAASAFCFAFFLEPAPSAVAIITSDPSSEHPVPTAS